MSIGGVSPEAVDLRSIGGMILETGSHIYWRCDPRGLGVFAVILCPPVLTPNSSFKAKTIPL